LQIATNKRGSATVYVGQKTFAGALARGTRLASQLGDLTEKHYIMLIIPMLAIVPMFAAAGWSLLYLLCGGGLGGAILIFIVAKMLGR
jgi:hypothetical protein